MVSLNECQKGQATPNRGKKYLAELLSQDEVNVLISDCSNQAPAGIRNRALMAVMYWCGLPIGEALALKAKEHRPEGDHGNASTKSVYIQRLSPQVVIETMQRRKWDR